MNIAKAKEIPGWHIDSELEWLAEEAHTHSRIVEVGAWLGRSTRALADNTFGTVFAVDTFEGSDEHREFLSDKPAVWLFTRFMENVADCGNVHPVINTSLDAANTFAIYNQRFDFIYIDANHDYIHVKEDILAWLPLVSPGGIISGHDLGPNWPEVEVAVREILPSFQMGPNQIWFYKP